ncbi:MAG: hypothetical protein PF517_05755 [Salinivirgaceae bacterium]|jgi:hypothetical protein|nr:hypothetical protein [Salinivirgaceae bacterium]
MKYILNKRTFIRWKIYIDRARMYIGYINFFMIGFVFLKTFKDTQWGHYIYENYYFTFPIMVVLFMVLSLILGFVDTKLGFREEEMRNASQTNPVQREMLSLLRDIKAKMEPDNK